MLKFVWYLIILVFLIDETRNRIEHNLPPPIQQYTDVLYPDFCDNQFMWRMVVSQLMWVPHNYRTHNHQCLCQITASWLLLVHHKFWRIKTRFYILRSIGMYTIRRGGKCSAQFGGGGWNFYGRDCSTGNGGSQCHTEFDSKYYCGSKCRTKFHSK